MGTQGPSRAPLAPLLLRLPSLKRVRSADTAPLSLAQRGFARAWAALAAGEAATGVALREAAAAVAALELGAIDAAALRRAGLDATSVRHLLHAAIDQAASPLAPSARQALREASIEAAARPAPAAWREPPAFVAALQQQPRAGPTAAGAARLILEPAESHADHCWGVAVMATLIAVDAGDDAAAPFLCGLAHHLHNAVLPDGGFAAEALLGAHLQTIVERSRDEALEQLPPALRAQVQRACALATQAGDAAAQAFQAADVIDRVAEAAHFERVARYRLETALDELGLVHAGPLKDFQDRIVADFGLRSPAGGA